MSPLVAAVVLLWVVVIVLAFALAGLRQQLRELRVNPPAAPGDVSTALTAVAPGPGHTLAAVLLVEERCGVCQEVLPRFAAAAGDTAGLDFIVLTDGDGAAVPPGPRVVADPVVHRALDPGWFPALLIVTADKVIASVEPAGSTEAVDALLAAAGERAVATR